MRVIANPDFLALPAETAKLFGAAQNASFFDLPEWYDLIVKCGLERDWEPRLYVSEDAALVVSAGSTAAGSEIRSCLNPYTMDYGFITRLSSEAAGTAISNLAASVARDNRSAEILLSGLDPDGLAFAAALSGFKKAGFIVKPYFAWGSWFEPTQGRNFESYFASRPSVLKNTFRRKYAALQKIARVDFRTYGHIEEFIADYDDVYRRSWKEPEPFPEFMPALMRMAAAKGALRYGVLEVDERPVAVQFWIVWKSRAIIYKLAYDEKWSGYSPGTLLTMGMVRHVLSEDHPDEINFGRGDDAYKKLWMSKRRELWGIEAVNPRTRRGFSRGLKLTAAKLRDRLLHRRRAA